MRNIILHIHGQLSRLFKYANKQLNMKRSQNQPLSDLRSLHPEKYYLNMRISFMPGSEILKR